MIKYLLLVSLVIHATLANSESASKKWLTLNGKRPSVIARGGFSGLFPESSDFANQMALGTSVHDVVVLCNLQLTKDGVGICQGDIRLDNTFSSFISLGPLNLFDPYSNGIRRQ